MCIYIYICSPRNQFGSHHRRGTACIIQATRIAKKPYNREAANQSLTPTPAKQCDPKQHCTLCEANAKSRCEHELRPPAKLVVDRVPQEAPCSHPKAEAPTPKHKAKQKAKPTPRAKAPQPKPNPENRAPQASQNWPNWTLNGA